MQRASGVTSKTNLSHTYGRHMSSSIIQNQLNSAHTYRSMKAQFLGQRLDVHTCGVAHVIVIIHVGHHVTLKHMMPRHHQFMYRCICAFVVRKKRKFGTVQINAWISTVSSSSRKPKHKVKGYRLHKHRRGEVCFYATVHYFLLSQFNVKSIQP